MPLRAVPQAMVAEAAGSHTQACVPNPPARTAAASPVVIVLASGQGKRFRESGGQTHKLHTDLCGLTVLERTLAAVKASGLPWHLEDAGHPGMGDSIAAAVQQTPQASGWLILPGDLPLIQPDTLLRMATTSMHTPVAVPIHAGQRGHPVRFSAVCGPDLSALSGDAGARSLLRHHVVHEVEVNHPGCVLDIDTLADWHRAQAHLHRLSQKATARCLVHSTDVDQLP